MTARFPSVAGTVPGLLPRPLVTDTRPRPMQGSSARWGLMRTGSKPNHTAQPCAPARWGSFFARLLQLVLLLGIGIPAAWAQVRPGADVLMGDSLHLVSGRHVAVLCHRASVLADGVHLLDTLRAAGVDVRAIFTPEHGFDADAPAGASVVSGLRHGIPVHSLYGKRRAPSAEMLRGIDVVLCDLQDVGARYYTYASTMALTLRAAAAAGVRFVVLDRPNPVNGIVVEGPVLDTAVVSFTGMFPIPVRHGLTLGELARMIAGERWMRGVATSALTVVPMRGWTRTMWFDETGLPWIAPSPNLPGPASALVYAGTCLFEGTSLSEGRGTGAPFRLVGAPALDSACLVRAVAGAHPGLDIRAAEFTPRATAAAPDPKHRDRLCRGVLISIADRGRARPFDAAWRLLVQLRACDSAAVRILPGLDRLLGVRNSRALVDDERRAELALESWHDAAVRFARVREPYLLY